MVLGAPTALLAGYHPAAIDEIADATLWTDWPGQTESAPSAPSPLVLREG